MKFAEAVEHTIGGGWGTDEPMEGTQAVTVIRGADFPAVQLRKLNGAPRRFESSTKVSSRRLQAGDIVLETSGGTKDRPTGRTVLITEELLQRVTTDVIPASFCRVVRLRSAVVNPAFAYYALQDLYDRGGTWEYQNQSTGISNFQFELFKQNFELPEFSLAEQRAIADVLGALDDKIAVNTKLAETIEQLGRTKLNKLGINEEPGGDAVHLEAYFDFNPRRAAVSDEAVLIDMQALPTSQPLVSRWDKGPKRGGTRFMNGDTLLARITPCLENRKTGFVDFLSDGEVGIGSTEFIVIRSRGGIPLGASYFVATSSRFRDFAIQNMVGTSGRQRVSATDIARFELDPIALPDLVEFGEWADTNLKVLGSLRDENRTLAATRDTLLPQLMSGKLRIKDIEKTVGEMV